MTIFTWILSYAVCLCVGWCAALIWPGLRSDDDDLQADDDDDLQADDETDDADASGSQWIAQPRMAAKAKLAAVLDKSGKLPKVVDWAKFDKACDQSGFGPPLKEWADKDRKDREDAKP